MDNIREKTISGAIWKFSERFIAQFVSLIVQIIIARILLPEDYSVVSIATIFFTFANIFVVGGLNVSLIQKKEATQRDFSAVLYFSVFCSLIIYVGLYFLAPVIARLYNNDLITSVIRVMGLILPINAVKSIWCAYISRTLQFKKFFFATLVGTIISALVGIVLAVKGFGVWALVAQQMTNAALDTLILILSTRIGLVIKFSFKELKTLFKYGWKVFVSNVIGAVYNELNPVIIGLKYKPSDLAFYTKGRSFPMLISSSATSTLSSVLFPVLSRYQDDKEKLLNYTRLYMRISSFIAFPLMLGFLAISESFVLVLLTDKWLPAVPYIQIFCCSTMFDMIHSGNCETIKAMGKSGTYLIMEIIKKTGYFMIIATFVFLSKNPIQLSLSAICCTVLATIVNSIPNSKLIGYKLGMQLKDLLPNLFISILMCSVVLVVGLLKINVVLLLIIQITIGVLLYLGVNLIIKNKSLYYLFDCIKSLLKRKRKSENEEIL